MKKIFLALMMMIGVVTAAQAQTELSVSYGAYTQMDAMDCHDGGSAVNAALGALNAGVNFHVAPGFWIGPSYTFSSSTRKHYDENKFYYHALMLNVRYNYYRNSIVTMYAKGGLGTVITHQTWPDDSKNKAYCAFQINPICAQVGLSNAISMFGELGFGAQGLLQVGVKIAL